MAWVAASNTSPAVAAATWNVSIVITPSGNNLAVLTGGFKVDPDAYVTYANQNLSISLISEGIDLVPALTTSAGGMSQMSFPF